MLLLTGATGTIGRPLLRRLLAAGVPVRCMVRDPQRLGAERGRVEIVRADLADSGSFPAALRGVDAVVHLAVAIRDQPRGSIEELASSATTLLVRAAERAGVERFVFFSTLGASPTNRARLMRAKALAERDVACSSVAHTIFAPSVAYAPDDPFVRLLVRLSRLPALVWPGSGRVPIQPIWAQDVADCVMAALPFGPHGAEAAGARFELAGPETITYRAFVHTVLEAANRRRALIGVPTPIVRGSLRLGARVMGDAAFATWDEAELLEVPMVSARGSADVERLGVAPRRLHEVFR